MNRIILVGYLNSDPVQKGEGKKRRAVMRVVTDAHYKRASKRQTVHTVVVWGKRGDACVKWLHNREWVAVRGRQMNNVHEGEGGEIRYTSQVVADEVEFLGLERSDNPQDHPGKQGSRDPVVIPAGDPVEMPDDGWDYGEDDEP